MFKTVGKRIGEHKHVIKMAGISYNFTRKKYALDNAGKTKEAKRRLKRIGLTSLHRAKKAMLARELAITKTAWNGQWQTLTLNQMDTFTTAVERAVSGKAQRGRSRYLVWNAAIPYTVNPEFVVDPTALKYQIWRINRMRAGERVPADRTRFEEVAEKWGWRKLGEEPKYLTGAGDVHLEWKGEAAIQATAGDGWRRDLWRREPRAEAKCRDWPKLRPVTEQHEATFKAEMCPDSLRALRWRRDLMYAS